MGLLDALFSGDSGGGLLGGLPSSWQWQNPEEQKKKADFLAALQQDPLTGAFGGTFTNPPPSSPFPDYKPPPPPTIFDQRNVPLSSLGGQQPGPIAGSFIPPSSPQPPPLPPAQTIAPAPQPAAQPAPVPDNGPVNMMNVGGYQMPQFGKMADYTPQAPAIPPKIANANAQAAPEAAGPLPSALGGNTLGGNFNAGLQNFSNSRGLLPALTGGITGLLTGQRTDPLGVQQQSQAATFKALVGAGMPPNVAMAAALNPKMLEQIGPEYFGKQTVDGGTDPLTGQKMLYKWQGGQLVPALPQASSSSGQPQGMGDVINKITAMKQQGATKEQLLAQIPNGYRDDVDALVNGKAVPANMGRAQLRGPLNILAHAVDPSYDEQMIPTRIQMRKDFSGEGKNGQAIGAFNTVQHHIGQVSDAIDEFEKAGGGSNYPLLNAGKLMLANNTGYDPNLRDAAQKLQDKLNATEHEVATAYNAGHITDSDRKTWNEIKASNLPADQLKQKLADFDELLAGKRDSLNHMYQQTFHEDAPTIDRKANEETSAKVHARLPGRSSSGIPAGWTVKVH